MFFLSLQEVKTAAGEKDFERGTPYARSNAVQILECTETEVKARVAGNQQQRYLTRLFRKNERLTGQCSCPAFGEFSSFCKHMVAVGLTLLREENTSTDQDATRSRPLTPFQQIQHYLDNLSSAQLVELILAQIEKDDSFFKRLWLKTQAVTTRNIDIKALQKTINKTIRIRHFVDYDAATDYAEGLLSIAEMLEELLAQDHADVVKTLTEQVFDELGEALNSIDDSDGGTAEPIERFRLLHIRACQKLKLDPRELAASLFRRALQDQWEFYGNVYSDYAAALGDEGQKHFIQLTKQAWENLPALNPSKHDKPHVNETDYGASSSRRVLKRWMEQFAGDDIETLVALERKDLSQPYTYIRIAELYTKNEQYHEALRWIEQGLQAFKNQSHSQNHLVEKAVELYHQLDQHGKAAELRWEQFTKNPSFNYYQSLKRSALKACAWDNYQKQAEHYVRQKRQNEKASSRPLSTFSEFAFEGYRLQNFNDILVEILLEEKRPHEALQIAKERDCKPGLWLVIADQLMQSLPQESIRIYQRFIVFQIEQTNNQAYEQAFQLLKKLQLVYENEGDGESFFAFVGTLKQKFKSKRNMMKLLEGI